MTAVSKKKSGNIRVNVLINLIRTLTITVLSFITFPYVTRALGDQAFGLYTWANSFVYYFLVLAKISIPNIAIRECSKVRDDREALSRKAQGFFLLQAVTTLFSFGLECALVFSVPALLENSAIIFVLSINFLVGLFSFEWIYIALEKHIYITVRSISLIALSALLTFLLIKPSSGYLAKQQIYLYALITILPTILTSVLNVLLLRKYISLRPTGHYDFKGMIKPLIVLFFISLFVTAYNQTDSFILGFLDPTKSAVGAYSVGVKGIDIVITLITSLYTVFMPRATFYYGQEDKRFYRNLLRYSFNITFFIAVPAIATMVPMATPIVHLVSGVEGYTDANIALMTLAAMMLTFSLADDIYTQILLPQKKEKLYLFAMLGGVILNVGLSLVFGGLVFKHRPVLGVAIGTMGSDALLLAYLIWVTRAYSCPAVFNVNSLKIVLVGIVVGVVSYFLYPVFHDLIQITSDGDWIRELVSLIIVVVIDALIYIGGLLLLREKLVSSFLPKRRKEREKENA